MRKKQPWDPQSADFGQCQCLLWVQGVGGKALPAPVHTPPLLTYSYLWETFFSSVLSSVWSLAPVQSCLFITTVMCWQHFLPSFCRNKLTRSKAVRSQRTEIFPVCSVGLFADGFDIPDYQSFEKLFWKYWLPTSMSPKRCHEHNTDVTASIQ